MTAGVKTSGQHDGYIACYFSHPVKSDSHKALEALGNAGCENLMAA